MGCRISRHVHIRWDQPYGTGSMRFVGLAAPHRWRRLVAVRGASPTPCEETGIYCCDYRRCACSPPSPADIPRQDIPSGTSYYNGGVVDGLRIATVGLKPSRVTRLRIHRHRCGQIYEKLVVFCLLHCAECSSLPLFTMLVFIHPWHDYLFAGCLLWPTT